MSPDGDERLASRTDLEYVELDAGGLLFDVGSGAVHVLNDTALLVWASLDGNRTVAALADELAERTGAPRDVIHDDLVRVIEDLRRCDLLEPAADRAGRTAVDRAVPAPYVAVPTGCGPQIEQLPWPVRLAVQIGDRRLGVRTNDVALGARLRDAFGPLVVDDPDVPANFSLRAPDPGAPGALHVLHHGCRVIARGRGASRLVAVLASLLASHEPAYRDLPRLSARVFVHGGEAIVVGYDVPLHIDRLEAQLGHEDVRLVIGEPPVDVARHEVIVPPLRPGGRDVALDELERSHPTPAGERAPADAGAYPIRAWITTAGRDGPGAHGHLVEIIRSLRMPEGHERARAEAGVALAHGLHLETAGSHADAATAIRRLARP